jgi:hypothetical protein
VRIAMLARSTCPIGRGTCIRVKRRASLIGISGLLPWLGFVYLIESQSSFLTTEALRMECSCWGSALTFDKSATYTCYWCSWPDSSLVLLSCLNKVSPRNQVKIQSCDTSLWRDAITDIESHIDSCCDTWLWAWLMCP